MLVLPFRYVLSMPDKHDVAGYMDELMGGPSPELARFTDALFRRRHHVPDNVTVHKKKVEADEYVPKKKKEKPAKVATLDPAAAPRGEVEGGPRTDSPPTAPAVEKPAAGKESAKMKPLDLSKLRSGTLSRLVPGRRTCNCQTRDHGLINNCLSCGRIVCEQEGSGPCSFCGSLVVTAHEQEVLSRNSRQVCPSLGTRLCSKAVLRPQRSVPPSSLTVYSPPSPRGSPCSQSKKLLEKLLNGTHQLEEVQEQLMKRATQQDSEALAKVVRPGGLWVGGRVWGRQQEKGCHAGPGLRERCGGPMAS